MATLPQPQPPDWLPGEKEELPRQDQITRRLPNENKIYGSLWVTNYRVAFKSADPDYDASVKDFEVTIGSIKTFRKQKPSDASGQKAKSYLKIITADFQHYQLMFPMNSGGNAKTRETVDRLLSSLAMLSVSFSTFSKENWEPTFVAMEPSWTGGLPMSEYERLGILSINEFRTSELNSKYKLSPTYPPVLVVPNSAADTQLEASANGRDGGNFPLVTWRSVVGGMLICRAMSQSSGQPPDEDLVVVRLMMLKCPNKLLRIFDVGPKRTYYYNRSYAQFAPEHLDLPSHSQIETIFNDIIENLHTNNDLDLARLGSPWSQLLSKMLEQISSLSKLIDSGVSILLQGNRKNMTHIAIITILQIVCDPSYRTIAGLCRLLEKDWIQITFPFREHTMLREKGGIPVFELTIHILWMLVQTYPTKFQYGDKLLGFLLDHLFSCRFVTFCIGMRRDWDRHRSTPSGLEPLSMPNATSLWAYIQTHVTEFISPSFDQSTIPSDYWPMEQTQPFGTPLAQPPAPNPNGILTGQLPHLLPTDALVSLPMIWLSRFVQHDYTHRTEMTKASALAKPGFGGNSIYSLSAAYRSLAVFPATALALPGLTMLHFKNARLTYLPLEIAAVTTLEDFSVAGNPIRHLPDDWVIHIGRNCKKLRILDLDKTSIGFVILSVHKHIPSLQHFKLGALERVGGSLEIAAAIPPWPLDAQLNALELPTNGLAVIPPRFVNLVNVTAVDLSGNRFTNIPIQLECFTRLTKLNFGDNLMPLIVPPSGGFRMEVLTNLILAGNGLETFPDHLGNLPALRTLSLARNKLTEISQRFFMQYKLLDILDISCNKLIMLPASVGYLSKLTYFDLSGNAITSMPDSVLGMTSLKYLDLSYNKLPSLAVCFGRMKSLHTLKISYNCMTVLPPHLGSLRDTLQNFDFSGNELVTPPLDIVRGGPKAVLDFLHDSLSGSKPIYRMKMMIVGEENVGKTTLVDQLTRRWKAASSDGIYEPISTLSTDGIAISTCSFHWKNEGEKKIARLADEFDVNISWWDFAGQELYYTTHQFFLSGRSIFVVCWNLEKPIEESRVDFWLNSIQSKIANATVVLVGTHLDGVKGPAREGLDALLKQTKLRLRMLFPSLDIMAFPASARTGEGMLELKDALEKKIVGSKHMGEILPSSYLLLERMVTDARATNPIPIVSKHKFLEMSLMCNISGEKELFRASNLLHNLGTLIYFEQDLVLSRYVILDPQWLAKLMSTLITTKHSFVTAGVIPHRALGQVWREFPLAMYGFLLGLLEKFEVTYNLSGFIDPSTLGNPTQLQLLSLTERNAADQKKKGKKLHKGSLSPRDRSLTPVQPTQQKEWLQALIPMLKRHPTVVIGNSSLRKLSAYANAGLLSTGNRNTLAMSTGVANGASGSSTTTSNGSGNDGLRSSLPESRRVTSLHFDPAAALGTPKSSNSGAQTPLTPHTPHSPNVTKILERGDAVGSFDLEGVSLIPSLLPTAPPVHFETRAMWPVLPARGEFEVNRDYLFDFIPDGLFSRLTVRLLQRFLDQTKEFVMWREGILLVRNDCTIFARLLTRGESKVLRVTCRGADFLDVGRVFSAVLEANGILFKEWARLRIAQEVPCPHCIAAKIDPPTYFPLELLLDAVRDDLNHVTCSVMFAGSGDKPDRIDEIPVPLEQLTPDFKLVYLKGTQINFTDLVIEKQIGVGGFAVVYKGTYKGQTIAIKQLTVGGGDEESSGSGRSGEHAPPGATSASASASSAAAGIAKVDPDAPIDPAKQQEEMDAVSAEEYSKAFNEFRKEAFMLTDIDDQFCVRMTGVCLKPFCLVTEFVQCGDLYSLCHREPVKPISWDLRLRIALDMAKGMNFLHTLRPPIIHNDLKSPNVLLSSMDPDAPVVAKISDFGLSMRMSKMYTRLVDNPVWIAPEIMRGQTYDTKADVYAYGVMLWEMLERRGFFVEVVFNSELEKKVMAGERPAIYNDCLPEYEKLIRACWDNDPLRRPPFENIVVLLQQLIVAYKSGTTKVGPSSEMSLPEAQRGRRAGAEKPAFIRELSQKPASTSPTSTTSSSSSAPSTPTGAMESAALAASAAAPLEPEVETVIKPAAPQSMTLNLKSIEEAPSTTKVRLNVGAGSRKAPTRADLLASKGSSTPTDKSRPELSVDVGQAGSGAISPPQVSPLSPPATSALSTLERLNNLIVSKNTSSSGGGLSPRGGDAPKSPRSQLSAEISSPSTAPAPAPAPAATTTVATTPTVPVPVIAVAPPTIAVATPVVVPPISITAAPKIEMSPASSPKAPLSATMRIQSRTGSRTMSLKSALNGSITGLLSSLQSLTEASGSINFDELDDDFDEDTNTLTQSPQASPSYNDPATGSATTTTTTIPVSFSSPLAQATPTALPPSASVLSPIFTPSTSPTLSPHSPQQQLPQTTTAPAVNAPKLPLISGQDAQARLVDLGEGLKGLLKTVLALSGALRTADTIGFQNAILETIKFLKSFRDTASVPAGLKSFNLAVTERLKLLRDSLKTLVQQVVTLLQVARLLLKQDPTVTKESFASSAGSFVSAFKITSGIMEMVNLSEITVLEIEPVEWSSN